LQDVPGRRLGESSARCDRCLGGGAPAGRSWRQGSLGLGPWPEPGVQPRL